jgi:hypothetical protein
MVPSLDPPLRSFAVALAMGATLFALQPSASLAQFFGSGGNGRQPSLPLPAYPGALDEGPPRPPGLIPSPKPYPGAPGSGTREIGAPVPMQPGAGPSRRQAKRVAPGIGKAKPEAPALVKGAPPEQPATPGGDLAVAKPAGTVPAAGTVAPPAPVSVSPLPAIPAPATPQPKPEAPADVAVAKPASVPPAAEPVPALVSAPAAQPAADVSLPKPGGTVSAIGVPPAAPDGAGKDARANGDAADPNHPVPVVRQVYPPPDAQ